MMTQVYSIRRCAFCQPVKTRPYKEALAEAKRRGWDTEKMGVAGQLIEGDVLDYFKILCRRLEGIINK